MKLNSLVRVSFFALVVMALSGCEGDVRDLTEPVEANQLNLSTLSIAPLSSSRTSLTVNPDEAIAFTLAGTDGSGQSVDIASTNRRWSVSDNNIATISDDGIFRGTQEGVVDISVLVGEVRAPPFTVNVSFGTLDRIGEIVGSEELQPCLAQTYSTEGIFTDGSPRDLDSVSWSIEPTESGTLTEGTESGSIILSGTTSGPITLIATSDNLSGSKVLTIDDSLETIGLANGLSLAANATLQLVAQGNYANESSPRDITNAVAWSITQGSDQAAVDDAGLVSGIAEGSAAVQAACGADINAVTNLTITAQITQLVADGGTDIDLSVGQLEQLRIATGTVYDEDEDVTELASWGVVGIDNTIASVSNVSSTRGQVTGLTRGEVIVRASYNNVSINFTIDVN